MNKQKLRRYIGNDSQLFGIKEYELIQGKAKGIRAFDINNGSGLEYTVLADRCLDIGKLSFKGVNYSYLSKAGFVSPEYCCGDDASFFRNFFGGFLTTCGLRNVGSPCIDNGENFTLHGSISNTPAEDVCASTVWDGDVPVMTVGGQVKDARFFGHNMVLTRKIVCQHGINRIMIHDCIENRGFKSELLMLLYHFNIGYPLLHDNALLLTPSRTVVPRDAEAAKGSHNWMNMQPPTPDYAEQVFYHDLKTDEAGNTCVAILHNWLSLGLALHFNKNQLFNFAQWKQMGEGEYVLGIEPCNCYAGGRLDPRNKDVLCHLEAGESRSFDIEIEIFSHPNEISDIKDRIKNLV